MKFKKTLRNSMLLQIIFYYLLGNALFILFLSTFFYYSSKFIIMKKEVDYNRENAEGSARYITLYADKLKNIINLMSVDTDVYHFLIENSRNSRTKIEKMMNLILENNKGIKAITIIGKNGNIISSEKDISLAVSKDMMKEKWYVDAINNSDIPVFNPVRKDNFPLNNILWVLSISRNIKNENGENIGVIVFDIKYEILTKYLNSLPLGKKNDSIIIDNKNNIIYYKDINCFISKNCLDKFLNADSNKLLMKIKIEDTNWQLISIPNMNDLVTLRKNFSFVVIAIFFISLTFTSIIAFSAIKKLLRPLIKLENHMKKFENSLNEFTLNQKTTYEIETLIEHFNDMVKKIRYLREYEIKALHSQINPHFLYNTLDTIIWMAEFEDSEKVVSITKSLANFFRISLSNGYEMIPLKDEITHIREYLFIQKQRYEDKLSYSVNVEDENLLSLKVPKIIIQPLVENSIYHGIKNIKERNGILNIDIYSEENNLYIRVKDNGVGFSESKKFQKSKTGGVGIKNVNKRIKFYYGQQYGIFIKKIPKNTPGSEVTIKLPL